MTSLAKCVSITHAAESLSNLLSVLPLDAAFITAPSSITDDQVCAWVVKAQKAALMTPFKPK